MQLAKFTKYGTLLVFFMTGAFICANAQNVKHKVQDEETLFSISQKYNVTVQQLKRWNNLSGSTISIGQTLIIKKQEKKVEGIYTVKPGDTLFSISQQFGVSVEDLRKWNDLQNNTLHVGDTLVISAKKQMKPDKKTAAKKSSLPTVSASEADGYYTVKSGDTLFRIAQMHHMTVAALKQLNNLDSNNIRVGQELKIEGTSPVQKATRSTTTNTTVPGSFIRYELKQGMTITDLLAMFEMSKSEFRRLNPGLKATYFDKGQLVNVLVPATKNRDTSYQVKNGMTLLGTVEASKYSTTAAGTTTSNGELYNPRALTAAHSSMAIGSVIFVKNSANQRGILVRINDRISKTGLKLSKAAWNALGLTGSSARVAMFRTDE